jgi:hypothetical protein
MKKFLILGICVLSGILGQAQYASLELSTGGFSFVPAFTDSQSNLIINAGTGTKGLLSAHMIGNIRSESMNPRGFIFITRAKVLDGKFKLSAGLHIPAIQIDQDTFETSTFFAQELIASYPVSEKVTLSAMYIHGKGRNNDMEINLFTLNANVVHGRFAFLSQIYRLDLDNTYGVAENITYKLSDKWDLRGFANHTASIGKFIWTAGVRRHL